MTDMLHCNYIIDGVQMALSPLRMLRECSVEPPLEPDGDPDTLADEQLDLKPDNYCFQDNLVEQYAQSLPIKRNFPLAFAGPYTKCFLAFLFLFSKKMWFLSLYFSEKVCF